MFSILFLEIFLYSLSRNNQSQWRSLLTPLFFLHSADTLYLCYCIDKAAGERHREEVFIAFEYDGSANASEPGFGLGAGLPGSVVLPMHRQSGSGGRVAGSVMQHSRRGGPETIVPRSPLGGSLVGGVAGAAGGRKGKGRRKETIFDALEEDEDTDTGGRTMKGRGGRHAHSQHHQQQKHQTKQGYHPQQSAALKTPLASYLDSENESIDEHRDERTPTGSQPIGGIARGRPSPSHVPKDDEEDDDEMNPFRRSTIDDEEMGQQPQQQRERAWLGQDGHRRSSSGAGAVAATAAYPFATTSSGTSPLSTSPPGAGVGKVGFGFVAPHGHRRSPSGASVLPGLVGATGAGLINVGASAGQPRPGERMLSSTQELNMKSQFLMNMRAFGTESQASAASSGVGSEGERGEASVMESRMSAGQVHGQGGGEKEEGEESMLGPGSGFFN
ncbi:hypothetical protein BDN70DRAFT_166613 [Pholiota conissans]|uniref:Uncharacterized protein n=1 Tax=Pholiota conissans TaxID=109636 RepID=A0A9P5YXK5_9AGAR|nr:hypothetical protein BDN70DRAFT_166613 [Pholiota conissans]